MAKRWRPENWERIKDPPLDNEAAYEAGATAMLELLRNRGYHVDRDASFSSVGEHATLSNKDTTGSYIFIPDDKENSDEM